MNTAPLACPVCGLSMHQETSSLKCRSGHAFDLASKGYANLFTDKNRNSQTPGDSRDMVAARRRFLDNGAYGILRQGLADRVRPLAGEMRVLVDAGCGEGAWTLGVWDAVHEAGTSVYGMDISKEAIRYASGRNKEIAWIVASLFHLPIRDGAADCLLNVFAPSSDPEFARVLRKNGMLLTAVPGRTHLWGLKSILYEAPYENDETLPELPSFTLVDVVRLEGCLQLKGQETLQDLLSMTPYFWRSPKAGIERYAKLDTLETPIEFLIALHRRK